MQTRIGQVRIRYRVPAGQSAAATLSSLQSVAQQKIADTCDQAFANIFEDDPTVYVLRRVTSRVAVLAKQRTSEARLAEQWGRNLCTSVVRTIVRDDNDDNLVRFDNQSEFVSCFLTRLALGDAWERWYFGAFNTYRGLPLGEIVTSVFEDNHEILPQILSSIKRSNALDYVLNLLGQTGQKHIWERLIRGKPADDQTIDAFRIFAQAAFAIADVLSLWRTARAQEADVLESYLRTKPASPNWTNGKSLADAVSSILRFLVNEKVLIYSSVPSEEQLSEFRDVLTSSFDWLDSAHLFNSVLSIFETTQFATANHKFTLRPRQATPAQNRVLDELLLRIHTGNLRLSANTSRAHEDLLRMIAALSDVADAANTATIAGLLESVVMSAVAIRESGYHNEALRQFQRGEIPTAILGTEAGQHLKVVAEAGESAQNLIAELVHSSIDASDAEGVLINSECAGLFLLIRVFQDLRLPVILKECGNESIHLLLAGLSISICKQAAWANDLFDAGAAEWAGIDLEEITELLVRLETFNWKQISDAILETALAQRLIGPDETLAPIESFEGEPYSSQTSAGLNYMCALLLRAWARWIPGLAHSSTAYLLDNFIRRSGTIIINEQRITVELEDRPLDEVLKLSGYLADTPPVAWLQNQSVRYRVSK